MICQLSTPLEVHRIIELGRTVVKAPVEILRKRVMAAITHSDSRVFLDKDKNNEVRGFIFGTVEELDGEDAVFIHLCVVKPLGDKGDVQAKQRERHLTLELVSKVEHWARERGLKNMYFMTRRNPEAFERKYKFKLDYYMMKREVKP